MADEKRLIDANALIDWLTKHTGFRGNCEDCTDIDCLDCIVENCVKNFPTVDAVPVVRCKDCKHYEWDEWDGVYVCTKIARYAKEDFFCSYGERKDNGN